MSNIDPVATLNPSVVGQAEKAHSAILYRALAGTTVDETQWITLNLAIAAGEIGRRELVARVVSAAKFDPTVVDTAIGALIASEMLQERTPHAGQLVVTDAGRTLVDEVRAATGGVVARAYGDIPPEDLATAARVLIAITAKLSQELAE